MKNVLVTAMTSATALAVCLSVSCAPAEVDDGTEEPVAESAASALTGTAGLLAEYFSGQNFTTRILTRIDSSVNFNWGTGSPAPGVPVDGFSVRWTGRVLAPSAGTYTFQTTSDDGVRLWVNGQKIIDDWTSHAATQRQGTIALEAGKSYDIKLEYFDDTTTASVYLGWIKPGQPGQSIPASQLSHPVDFTRGVYQGARAAEIDAYQSWFGPRKIQVVGDYSGGDKWPEFESGWVISGWKDWVAADPQNRMVQTGVPVWADVGSLAECAQGAYDEHYRNMGTNFKNAGMGRTVFRFGWEEYGNWFKWTVKSQDASGAWHDDATKIANFKTCFQRFSRAIHTTDPQAIVAWDAEIFDAFNEAVYPGDDVVDHVSRDIYDSSWLAGTYPFPVPCDQACMTARQEKAWNEDLGPGIVRIANFATKHSKPLDLGEWGVMWRKDGHGGLDNPTFVQHIYELMTGRLSGLLPGFQPGYASYFEALADKNAAGEYTTDTRLRSTSTFTTAYPRAAQKYRELFGQ